MCEMGSHDPFGHLKHKLCSKEGSRVKLTVWLPTIKSRESTQFTYMHVACHIPLKSSQRGLQLYFRPHINWRSAKKVTGPQSREKPKFGNFETPTWESWDKMPFGCGPHGEAQNILWGGRWWLPPSLGHGESCESELPVARPSTKSAPTMH
jgi:hypothetical protein